MIVVGGEALVDLVQAVDGSVTAKLGGGPFNVARTIGRLGQSVAFLGVISTDRFGSRLYERLVADGVDPSAIVRTESPTTLAAAELDDTGAATYHFYIAGTSAPSLSQVPASVSDPVAVHLGSLGLVLEPMASTLMQYLDTLSAHTLVMLDPNCRTRVIDDRATYLRRLDDAYACSHVVKISTDDAEYLAPDAQPIHLARQLVDGGMRVVLLTAGRDGTWVVSPGAQTMVPTVPIAVADTIGAGDSFGGGFLAWWTGNGLGVDELADHDAVVAATNAAQQVAAFTCQQVGAEPPRRAQLPPEWGGAWTPT